MGEELLEELAGAMVLGALLDRVREKWGTYELLDHWKQGEFHHDIVLRIPDSQAQLPGEILVVATNCNGGVKELLCFSEVPDRYALWCRRCPDNPEFSGTVPTVLGESRTSHWFDPCVLLEDEARSELKAEFRTRQQGGGWEPRTDG